MLSPEASMVFAEPRCFRELAGKKRGQPVPGAKQRPSIQRRDGSMFHGSHTKTQPVTSGVLGSRRVI